MKKIFFIFILLNTSSAFAENVIYKCTSTTVEITYQNNSGEKNECVKTNFASFPNINVFKLDEQKIKKNNTIHNSEPENMTTKNSYSDEQKIRDSKRALILSQELNQENEQLNTVATMLKNLKDSNSKDSTQISQLEELKKSHENNIASIQKELGNTKIIPASQDLKIEKTNTNTDFNNQSMIVTKAITPEKNTQMSTSISNNVGLSNNKSVSKSSELLKKDIKNKVLTNTSTLSEDNISNNLSSKNDKNIKSDIKKSSHKANSLGSSVIIYNSGLQSMPKSKD